MNRTGKMVVCDRCKMTTFRPDVGGFYEQAAGWTVFAPPDESRSIDLCPACSRDLKRTFDNFMDSYKDTCEGMFIRHDSYAKVTEERND